MRTDTGLDPIIYPKRKKKSKSKSKNRLQPVTARLMSGRGVLKVRPRVYHQFTSSRWDGDRKSPASRPCDVGGGWGLGTSEHLGDTVLRPVTGARMEFAGGSHPLAELQPDESSDSKRIARGTLDLHAQPRLCANVFKQPGGAAVLRHNQVDTTILITCSCCSPGYAAPGAGW